MLIIGLTGSIATGKSTVSSLLSSPPYSLPIIDADHLARKVVEPGTPGYNAIVNYFGPSTPDLLLPPPKPTSDDAAQSDTDTGKDTTAQDKQREKLRPLNRPALGRRVFGISEERKRDRMILNKIVHPAVRWEVYKSLLYYYIHGFWAVILDVPLLFESGMDLICGTVIVVGVTDSAVQMSRLRARDPHLSPEDAENRVLSQGDVRGKVEKAEFRGTETGRGVIVWNDGDKDDLEREVRRAVGTVSGSSPRWWSWCLLLAPPLGVGVAAWNLAVNYGIRRRWEKRAAGERARL
ncbi:P-loop containing nucleoside triphosphate hydrolase protein [Aspergillus californicus]